MRVVLDTCVLYPPILREILIGTARAGAYEPVWSDAILDEWRHIAARDGAENQMLVASEIARLTAHFPDAGTEVAETDMRDLYLPDRHDVHVLAAARKAQAALIVTANLRDFPKSVLAQWTMDAVHPDAFLRDMWLADPSLVGSVIETVLDQASVLAGTQVSVRALLKRARLPRLAKAMARGADDGPASPGH